MIPNARSDGTNHDDMVNNISIAYLGPEASFSHQAALNIVQTSENEVSDSPSSPNSQIILKPSPSFAAVFSAIQAQSQTYAVIPTENSTNGSVVQVLDLLAQCGLDEKSLYPDIEVCAEYYLAVHHCLFVSNKVFHGSGGSSPPPAAQKNGQCRTVEIETSSFSNIKQLYTHPQVWGQCNRFLSTHFTGIERNDVSSTSKAAQIVSQDQSGQSAAIASKLAGTKHDLNCLAENIEDDSTGNTTRFLVVRNRQERSFLNFSPHLKHQGRSTIQDLNYKSLLLFTIPHSLPGSLADALAVFKQFNFNLTSIETRPSGQRSWHYVFFVECEERRSRLSFQKSASGDIDSENHNEASDEIIEHTDNSNLKKMIHVLEQHTESVRHLGSWIDMLQFKT